MLALGVGRGLVVLGDRRFALPERLEEHSRMWRGRRAGATVGARSTHESVEVAYLEIICSLYVLAYIVRRMADLTGGGAAAQCRVSWHGPEARGRRQRPIGRSERATACGRRCEEGEKNLLLPRRVWLAPTCHQLPECSWSPAAAKRLLGTNCLAQGLLAMASRFYGERCPSELRMPASWRV